jgi:hypothetical protein
MREWILIKVPRKSGIARRLVENGYEIYELSQLNIAFLGVYLSSKTPELKSNIPLSGPYRCALVWAFLL